MAETPPIAELIPLDEEVIGLSALTQKMVDAKVKNKRIAQRKRDWEAKVEEEEAEEEEKHNKVDRLAQEAERKANKKKQVSAILSFSGLG